MIGRLLCRLGLHAFDPPERFDQQYCRRKHCGWERYSTQLDGLRRAWREWALKLMDEK